jgi:hypothetical protein
LLIESRRRAYLSAMQVVTGCRAELPFAAPSARTAVAGGAGRGHRFRSAAGIGAPEAPARSRASGRKSRSRPAARPNPAKPVEAEEQPAARARPRAAPRFALQLLRAGSCLLLVELATGEPFQSRDPSYLLLKDMLRAAGLPDAPQIIGEPVRWPLLVRGNMDQGPDAARDFVQGFIGRAWKTPLHLCG